MRSLLCASVLTDGWAMTFWFAASDGLPPSDWAGVVRLLDRDTFAAVCVCVCVHFTASGNRAFLFWGGF